MLSGTVPFKANSMNDLHKLILKGTYNEIKDISPGIINKNYFDKFKFIFTNLFYFEIDAKSLISSLLEIDPKKRITIDQILNHNWIKSCEFKNKSTGKI